MNITTDDFISRAKEIHGDKYDYSKVNYINCISKVCIICPIHGEFWQTPNKHLNAKQGCIKCGGRYPYNTETFKEKVRPIMDKSYDDKDLIYVNNKTKVKLFCHHKDKNGQEHGDFWISPSHLLNGEGCPKCRYVKSANSKRRSLNEVIELCRNVHGDKFDYSLIKEYKTDRIKYPIICNNCGNIFYQTINNHICNRQGCPYCGRINTGLKKRKTTEDFIKNAIKKYGENKYGYECVKYIKNYIKVKIHCNTCNKYFYMTPSNFLTGQGCPYCKQSHLEKIIEKELNERGINFIYQKRFKWLGKQSLDFYLPEYHSAIECQGKQHFQNDGLFECLETQTKRDNKKRDLCSDNNIKLYYFSNLNISYPYKVFEDVNELFNHILNLR